MISLSLLTTTQQLSRWRQSPENASRFVAFPNFMNITAKMILTSLASRPSCCPQMLAAIAKRRPSWKLSAALSVTCRTTVKSVNQYGNAPALLITATSPGCLYSYIAKCRDAANCELKRRRVSKKTCRKTLLKPLQLDASQTQVLMQKLPGIRGHGQIRPLLVQPSSRVMRPGSEYSKALLAFQQSLEQDILEQTEALYSKDKSFSITARFGHFRLQEWKGSASSVAEFAAMMKHPRTRATIADR